MAKFDASDNKIYEGVYGRVLQLHGHVLRRRIFLKIGRHVYLYTLFFSCFIITQYATENSTRVIKMNLIST